MSTNVIKPTTPAAKPAAETDLKTMLERAQAGDESVVPQVRKLLENPIAVEAFGGFLSEKVIHAFIEGLGGKSVLFREAVLCRLKAMRAELLGENPTSLERLLVERVVVCWLQVQDAELRATQVKDPTLKQAEFHQKRMDATNRRYLASLKSLALVRKLVIPALQVNIAKKQINVLNTDIPQ